MTTISASELRGRRARLAERLPPWSLALVRGAPAPVASRRFRQTNELLWLTGLEVPHAYVLVEADGGQTTVYVPRRDEELERSDGPRLAAEDADEVRSLSGADAVRPLEALPTDLGRTLFRGGARVVYTPLAPAEGARESRDSLLLGAGARLVDPWAPRESDEARFAAALRAQFPSIEVRDLSPELDELRLRKSEAELALLRDAARLCGEAVLEAMRSTEPGVYEYELGAVADFVFLRGGAAGGAYEAIVASGTNAWYGHYGAKSGRLAAGELVLMDYAPDLRGYTSDIGRMWPVSGRFEPWQLELYGFVLRYHRELLARLRPGALADEVLDGAAAVMRRVHEETAWSKPVYREAARGALDFRGHLSHPVGMAVHDVGRYHDRPLEPGLVLTVDPMLWVPEERLYVRCEDTVAIVAGGIENLTGFVPLDPEQIEAVMAEPGLLQTYPRRP